MESKLQELTRSLYQDGVEKGQAEAERLLAESRAEAGRILDSAREAANGIVGAATEQSRLLKQRTEKELAVAGEQALARFRAELAASLELAVLRPAMAATLADPAIVGQVLVALVSNWHPENSDRRLSATVPESLRPGLEAWFTANAAHVLKDGLAIRSDARTGTSFRVAPEDEGWQLVFDERDLEALYRSFLKTRTAHLLFGEH